MSVNNHYSYGSVNGNGIRSFCTSFPELQSHLVFHLFGLKHCCQSILLDIVWVCSLSGGWLIAVVASQSFAWPHDFYHRHYLMFMDSIIQFFSRRPLSSGIGIAAPAILSFNYRRLLSQETTVLNGNAEWINERICMLLLSGLL
jgi:hypothetical protein